MQESQIICTVSILEIFLYILLKFLISTNLWHCTGYADDLYT